MITDSILTTFQGVASFIVNLFPTAPMVTGPNGTTPCCAGYLIGTLDVTTTQLTNSINALTNNPLTVLINWTLFEFVVTALLTIVLAQFAANMAIKIAMLFKP